MVKRPLSRAASVLLLDALLVSCAHTIPPAPPPPLPLAAAPSPPPVTPPVGAMASAPRAFDPAPWVEDLHALISELSSHYANLEWAANDRKMDLPALVTRIEGRLHDAKTDAEAQKAFQSFLDAFGDAHLQIDWSPKRPEPDPKTGPLCTRLGFDAKPKAGVDFALASDWKAIADADAADFPGGVLHLKNGTKLGTIRIGLFMEEIHPAMCEVARREMGLADDAACDDDCKEKLTMRVANQMTAALERRAVSLAHEGVSALVVDITQNGGGSSWMEPAERVLTPVPLRAPRMGFVRHPHWATQFQKELKDIKTDRATKNDPILATAEATLHAALDEANTPCDRSALWIAGAAKPLCSQLVTNRIYSSGLLPYAKAGAYDGWASQGALYSPREYAWHEGVVSLPMIVLVDPNTASASEQFAAMLADNHAALIVGSLTLGCGCGFTNGGIHTSLPHSGASVHIPDCVRLRADGSNEVNGIVPDVLLPVVWRDSPYQRATKIVVGLETASKKLSLRR